MICKVKVQKEKKESAAEIQQEEYNEFFGDYSRETSAAELRDYERFLSDNVVTPFYHERLMYLRCNMNLKEILSRKNPYLLKAKNISSSDELVRSIVEAFLSSQEETMFGNKLESFAVYVSSKLDNGFKSELPSIDLEFERDDNYYIVGIKSGTNWANSDQAARMKDNFKTARGYLTKIKGVRKNIIPVNGCIYGKNAKLFKAHQEDPEKSFYRVAGQDFWQFISGDKEFYKEIIKPIEDEAQERDRAFKEAFDGKINAMSMEFSSIFTFRDPERLGVIDWEKIVEYISGRGKTAIAFPKEEKSAECEEYEALKKARTKVEKEEEQREKEIKQEVKKKS
jgi:site-specific DNA-methyltransferase (cytosine-N4-specific)